MVKLGILNSRMKDFYDIWLLLRHFDFKGPILSEAISKTFATRGRTIQPEPIALTNNFAEDTAKGAQWRGFIRKNRLKHAPRNLVEVITAIAAFLRPIAEQRQRALLLKGPGRRLDHGANSGKIDSRRSAILRTGFITKNQGSQRGTEN